MTNTVVDIIQHHDDAMFNSEEFVFGLQEMQMRLPHSWRSYNVDVASCDAVANVIEISRADNLLVIINPALIISDNMALGLNFETVDSPTEVACLVANDPRSSGSDFIPDYSTRPGFDRFVTRLAAQPKFGRYDGREPWIFMVKRSAVVKLLAEKIDLTWGQIPVLLGAGTVGAQHVFAHSYVDYYLNNRVEMLDILPTNVQSLLDVGGGEGNFGATFETQRGGHATLVEQHREAAAHARTRGLDVIEGNFLTAEVRKPYDCVSMLDVLEHTIDPLKVLEKAHNIVKPGGFLLLSVPNAGHWSLVSDLIEGRFDYQPVGILCNTHIRFFTRHSLELLLTKAKFKVEQWRPVISPPPPDFMEFISSSPPSWLMPDTENLSTGCFHVLASRK